MGPLGRFAALRPGNRVLGVVFGAFPFLAAVDAQVLVAAWVGGAAEADLVPGPGVGVEGGAGVAGPQAPEMPGVEAVPLVGILDRLDELTLLRTPPSDESAGRRPHGLPRRGRPGFGATLRRLRACPRSASRRSVPASNRWSISSVTGTFGSSCWASSRSRRARTVGSSVASKNESWGSVSSRASTTPAVTRSQRPTSPSTSKSPKRPLLPGVTGSPCASPARQVLAHRSPSRRSREARIPMPPTIAASRGANMGGPISML